MTLLAYFCRLFLKAFSTYSLIAVFVLTFFTGCKTNKNTFIHRGYHNLTARFNGYYYATESIKEGEDKIRTNYKFNYDEILPVFLVPDNENAKATFPEFDKAIKKSSNCIQRHTIKDKKGNEIPKAGKWIDNNWNVIGIAHFYKREFFSGIEAFEYVIRTYKTKDRYKAMVWLARSYNELGAPSQAEPIIGLLKDDKNISKYAKKELPALQADYYIKRGMYKEAQEALENALKGGSKKTNKYLAMIKGRPSKITRARYSFILAQLYEAQNDNRKAVVYYKKTIDCKPNYDLVFNAKIKIARLADIKNGNVARLKRDLKRMTLDIKNKEYLDVIYYTLGEISEKEKNTDEAISYYKLSVANSTQNPKQKALSYLKLGEINFEQANYTASGGYYDSTMVTLPKDYKDYDAISRRKATLETLVGYIKTIQREDSLQRIARMSEADRDRFIEKLIKRIEDEEARKREELELSQSQNSNPNNNGNLPNNGLPVIGDGSAASWYFYNQTTLSFGVNDFIKKWGNRKLEDNWRRSQKSLAFVDNTTETDSANADGKTATSKGATNGKKSKDSYLVGLPLSDSLMVKSDNKIIDSYYNLASTYKEDLNNNKKAIGAYEELNKRYPSNKYKPSTYYQLYRIYTSTRNQALADNYKNKLLSEYPNSEYAQIIKNPNYAAEKNSQKGEVELFYTETYTDYSNGDFAQAYAKSRDAAAKFGKNDFSGKFAFINALCIGKLKGADSLEMALKKVQALYPKDPVSNQAQEIITVLYNLKHPSEATGNQASGGIQRDTFSLNPDKPHLVIAVSPDVADAANAFRTALSDFNTKYYSNSSLEITSSLFGSSSQITTIKLFPNADAAMDYIKNMKSDPVVFSGKVQPADFTIMAISEDNLPRLFRKKQVNYYLPFFNDHYKSK